MRGPSPEGLARARGGPEPRTLVSRVRLGRRARHPTSFSLSASALALASLGSLSLCLLPRAWGCRCLAYAPALLQASRRRSFGVRVGRAAAMARVRMGARFEAALIMVAPGLWPVERSRVCSHVAASSRDKYVSRMGVRPIRTPIISIRMGSGGSETLLVPPRISRHEASAKERPAATLKSGLALSSVAYRSAERESTAIRAQRARRPGLKSRCDGRIRLDGRARERATCGGTRDAPDFTPWMAHTFELIEQISCLRRCSHYLESS